MLPCIFSLSHDAFTNLRQDFNSNEYLECIKELIRVDRSWIPHEDGYSLYIRPTIISTYVCLFIVVISPHCLQPYLGVGPAQSVKLYTILSPVGPYYPEGFKPVKLYADPEHVRAWRGGSGDSKIGAYATLISSMCILFVVR